MRIAIDAMGGDHAPEAPVNGALDALQTLAPEDELILVGDEQTIREAMQERGFKDPEQVSIEPTTQVITMDEPPVEALRTKKDSSIVKLAWLGSKRCPNPVDVTISAGNTGACVAAAQMYMRRLPNVHRPGVAVTMPTFFGPVVICDVGANIAPKPAHLYQYAHMASVYAKRVHGIDNPRVALLSVGGEEGKGTSLVKSTAKLCKGDPSLNYVGYAEGRDLFDNKCDVLVTEGFTGNVVLKLAEGLSSGLFKTIAHEIMEIDPDLALRFEPVVKSIYAKHDYHEYGGAPLLGANGICLISHGSSIARTFKSAIKTSRRYMELGINQSIVDVLAEHLVPGEAS